MHFTLALSIILALSLQCQVTISLVIKEEEAVRGATSGSHVEGFGDRVTSPTNRVWSQNSNQGSHRTNSIHMESDDEDTDEEVEAVFDNRFTNEENQPTRQTLSPGQKMKAAWVKFSDRISTFLSKLSKVIFFWRKTQPAPHFSEAAFMNHELDELLKHITDYKLHGTDPKLLTARFASIIKGRQVKNPWKFFKQITGQDFALDRTSEYSKLNFKLIDNLEHQLTVAKNAMQAYQATQQRLIQSVDELKEFLRERIDPNIDMDELADAFRKYTTSLRVKPLPIAHQYQLTFLHMFGQAHITAPDLRAETIARLNSLDGHPENFGLEVSFQRKAEQWDLSEEKTKAIIKAFPLIDKSLKDLYVVQDVQTFMGRSGQKVLPEYYQRLKHEADVTLERVHGVLMGWFGTETEANMVFNKIYLSTLAEGPLADKKGSPIEWMLLPLLEPAGQGRSLKTITNMNAVMKSMGLLPQIDFAQKYQEFITAATKALADHYQSTQGLRTVRNILTHAIGEMNVKS
ncbi:hypothetical protein DFH28DRAFT_1023216 [Melampsora americana]|nr:hypothetical protein DFH28DRAFT_1023216 [Melampsora americana]